MRHFFQRRLDGLFRLGGGSLALHGGIEPRLEQGQQLTGDRRIAVERGGDEILALRDAGLLQIAPVRAKQRDAARP